MHKTLFMDHVKTCGFFACALNSEMSLKLALSRCAVLHTQANENEQIGATKKVNKNKEIIDQGAREAGGAQSQHILYFVIL